MGYLGRPYVITRALTCRKQAVSVSEGCDVRKPGLPWLALMMEGGMLNQACRWPLEAGKGEEICSPLEPSERNAARPTPGFSPVSLISDPRTEDRTLVLSHLDWDNLLQQQ